MWLTERYKGGRDEAVYLKLKDPLKVARPLARKTLTKSSIMPPGLREEGNRQQMPVGGQCPVFTGSIVRTGEGEFLGRLATQRIMKSQREAFSGDGIALIGGILSRIDLRECQRCSGRCATLRTSRAGRRK